MQRRLRPDILLCAAALAATSGCVIPIAPQFEDEPNYPPFIEKADPLEGEEVEGPPNGRATFLVTVGDPNIHDVLYVRWIFDYPKLVDGTSQVAEGTRRLEPNGRMIREPIAFEPSCVLHPIARGLTRHRLLLVVSDREYLRPIAGQVPPLAPLDAVPDGSIPARAAWVINMECR